MDLVPTSTATESNGYYFLSPSLLVSCQCLLPLAEINSWKIQQYKAEYGRESVGLIDNKLITSRNTTKLGDGLDAGNEGKKSRITSRSWVLRN